MSSRSYTSLSSPYQPRHSNAHFLSLLIVHLLILFDTQLNALFFSKPPFRSLPYRLSHRYYDPNIRYHWYTSNPYSNRPTSDRGYPQPVIEDQSATYFKPRQPLTGGAVNEMLLRSSKKTTEINGRIEHSSAVNSNASVLNASSNTNVTKLEQLIQLASYFDRSGCFPRLVCEVEFYNENATSAPTTAERLVLKVYGLASGRSKYREAAIIGSNARKLSAENPCGNMTDTCHQKLVHNLRNKDPHITRH